MQGSAEAVQRRRGAQCTQAGRRLYRGGAGAQCTQQAVTSWQTSQMSTHGSACHTCRRGASFRAYPATFTGPRHPVVQRASLYGAAHSPTPPAAALVQLASSSPRQQQSVPSGNARGRFFFSPEERNQCQQLADWSSGPWSSCSHQNAQHVVSAPSHRQAFCNTATSRIR